ncbi:restriction endonuclease subunit S [Mesorhizobium sp. M0618]|uniref:restriction endonuclease subunit S n=1 Tax=unclassified Mesorhizobium TaxID=325217 RepID=UPI00333B0F63
MSSKTKYLAPEAVGSPTLTPKLRFPEFDNSPLTDVRLGDVTTESTYRNGSGRPKSVVMGVSRTDGIVPMEERLIASDATRYKIVQKDWFAYNPMRLNIGSIARWQGDTDILVSPDYVVFRCKTTGPSRLDPTYLDLFRRSEAWEDFVSETGDGSVRVRIYYRDLARLKLALPSFDEQRKVGECLASADALIEAQGRKVDSLRTHKKGLMRQIFPLKGETQPRLRFPDFRGAREWSFDALGNLFDTSSGGTPDRTNKEYWNGSIPWITTSIVNFSIITDADEYISDDGLRNSSAKVFPKKTILMAMYGQGKTRGQVAMLGVKAATNQACAAILPQKGIDPNFVFLNLGSRYEELRGLSNSGGQENLSQGLIKGLQFSFPNDYAEQQRIADCLNSLDDLIATESQKLGALKTHKKGLMQQLFPSVAEADA